MKRTRRKVRVKLDLRSWKEVKEVGEVKEVKEVRELKEVMTNRWTLSVILICDLYICL